MLDIEQNYIDEENKKQENKKPYICPELNIIDLEKANTYILENAAKHDIILTLEEVEEIMYAEIDYQEDAGFIEDVFFLN